MVKYLNNNVSGFNAWSATREEKKSGISTWLIWIGVFLLTWWLFSAWLTPKTEKQVSTNNISAPVIKEDLTKITIKTLESDNISAKVQGARISDISLKKFMADATSKSDENAEKVKLLPTQNEFIEIGLLANGTSAPTIETQWKTSQTKDGNILMTWKNSDGIEFSRIMSVDNYIVSVHDEIKNNSRHDVSFAPYARVVKSEHEKSQAGVAAGGVAFTESKIKRKSWRSLSKEARAYQTNSGFVGFETQYWEVIAQIAGDDQTIRMKQRTDGLYQADAAAAAISVPAGKTIGMETKIYAGPKNQADLNTATESITGINQTIDYGWFWFLSRPFLWIVNVLFAFAGNYGIAIILLTLLLRILMWPLTKKSYTSMAAMQKMQPEMQRIQKLYANDKLRLQQELMKVYQNNKTSPMSGCLPMLLQIPIFFALYKALLISVPMRGAGFLWISDLSAADPTSIFNLFGLLPYNVPGFLTIGILPILMGLTMWIQQRMQTAAPEGDTKNNPAAQMTKMMKWMPIIFVFMFAWMPAGLVLYWAVSNLFGIGQTWLIKRKMK